MAPGVPGVQDVRSVPCGCLCVGLWTADDEGVLEAEEVEDVADARARRGVAVAGVRLCVDEGGLETEEVEDVERSESRALVAVGVAGLARIDRKDPCRSDFGLPSE